MVLPPMEFNFRKTVKDGKKGYVLESFKNVLGIDEVPSEYTKIGPMVRMGYVQKGLIVMKPHNSTKLMIIYTTELYDPTFLSQREFDCLECVIKDAGTRLAKMRYLTMWKGETTIEEGPIRLTFERVVKDDERYYILKSFSGIPEIYGMPGIYVKYVNDGSMIRQSCVNSCVLYYRVGKDTNFGKMIRSENTYATTYITEKEFNIIKRVVKEAAPRLEAYLWKGEVKIIQ